MDHKAGATKAIEVKRADREEEAGDVRYTSQPTDVCSFKAGEGVDCVDTREGRCVEGCWSSRREGEACYCVGVVQSWVVGSGW